MTTNQTASAAAASLVERVFDHLVEGGCSDATADLVPAWWRLSNSCHHHAYELDPTPAEAATVVADVRWLADQAAAVR